jgi:hypothetical protein
VKKKPTAAVPFKRAKYGCPIKLSLSRVCSDNPVVYGENAKKNGE